MKLLTNSSLLLHKKLASSKIFGSLQNNALYLSKSATEYSYLFFNHSPVNNQRGLAARFYASNTKGLNNSLSSAVTALPAEVVQNRVKLWLNAARHGKDEFTKQNMDAEEFVPLSILATYPSCKGFTIDQLRTILKDSNKQFEFNSDETKVRLNPAHVQKKLKNNIPKNSNLSKKPVTMEWIQFENLFKHRFCRNVPFHQAKRALRESPQWEFTRDEKWVRLKIGVPPPYGPNSLARQQAKLSNELSSNRVEG